jgi:hypothetical protein
MYNSLINTLSDYKVRHIPYLKTIFNWVKNKKKQYNTFNFDHIREKIKTSDTIFILGSGESINSMTSTQWSHIAKHDSIGMNFWPLHPFIPTYYHSEYMHSNLLFNHYTKTISHQIKTKYQNTLFFLSGNRAVTRGIHPRTVPDLFPDNASVCFYTYKKPIKGNSSADFSKKSFSKTLFYRGGLTQVIDLMDKVGYKKIVMVGVDLNNHIQFYDHLPEVQWCFETGYRAKPDKTNPGIHGTMVKKVGKMTVEEYLYVLNDLYFQQNNIELYIASPKSRLAEKIPIYNFTD